MDLFSQPGAWTSVLLALSACILVSAALFLALLPSTSASGMGNAATPAQTLFSIYVRCGRARNLACSPCDRLGRRYPVANTCQIPHFKSLSDIYTHVFGYKSDGLFVEVGAYDGESFSNSSGLADLGWTGHYLEPIPAYAAACASRHAGNRKVKVHTLCAGEKDGVEVQLSAAGPFTSAVPDEVEAVKSSKLAGVLTALGWGHTSSPSTVVTTTTTSLNTFFTREGLAPRLVDVLIIDVEGFEWPILRAFDLKRFAPSLVIVEIQEQQARYAGNERTQEDAVALFKYFQQAGYAILYRDVINTIFIHKDVRCRGGD